MDKTVLTSAVIAEVPAQPLNPNALISIAISFQMLPQRLYPLGVLWLLQFVSRSW